MSEHAAEWRPPHSPFLIALVVTLATFMEVLDTSIANVSLPHIAGNLSATIDESTWILTSYLVANAIILPLSAWFSSILGRKRYYMISVALFTVASIFSGFAPSLPWLVFFRVLQGLGGGGLQPSEQAILADTFPAEKLGMGMAVYGFAVVTAPIIGPTLGGWITDNFSWRWIFFINIPVGIVSMYLTNKLVSDPPHFKRRKWGERGFKIDYIGIGLITLGIAALQVVLDKGQREDWFESQFITALTVIAIITLIAAVIWELRVKDPAVDLHLLKERNFLMSSFMMFMLGVVLFGSTVLLPLFLQTLMGYPATTAGLVISPGGLITMVSMPLVGFLLTKVQPRWLIGFGLCVASFSLFQMSHFNLEISYKTAVIARMIQAGGLGFLFVPINSAAYAFVPREKNTSASSLINLGRNLGGSFGIAIVTTLLSRFSQASQHLLIARMTPYDAHYQGALHQTTQSLIARGVAAAKALPMAQGMMYREVLRQSTMLAYVYNFRLMGFAFLATLPMVFFFKKSVPKKGAPPVH